MSNEDDAMNGGATTTTAIGTATITPSYPPAAADAAEPEQTPAAEAEAETEPLAKKRKMTKRDKQRKTALCKHFDKPGGCPFANCRFAHGRSDVAPTAIVSLAEQRQFIRDQVLKREEGRFQVKADAATTAGRAKPAGLARRGTMVERYYTELFGCDIMGKPRHDQYVHMHSNRLCVVGVAHSHVLMDEVIESIEFTSSVLDSRVSGKKKKGGVFLLPETILCHVRCQSGASYAIRSCIRGTLLEVNDELVTNPTLLQEKHLSDGYVVIVQPKTAEVIEIQASLLAKDEYTQYRHLVATTETVAPTPAVDTEITIETTPAVAALDTTTSTAMTTE